MKQLKDLGEFGLIAKIRDLAPSGAALLGIGDDCAAFAPPPGQISLISTDMLLEDVHFKLAWSDYRAIGYKAVAVNVSDIAAMGGTPAAIFLALAAPAETPVAQLDALLEGVHEALDYYDVALLGGDTCRSRAGLVLTVTVYGHVREEEMIRRSGAHPGDGVWVSGCLGDSALALKLLQQGAQPPAAVAARHHRPEARVALGRELARQRLATAMIDVSDGLLADLGHVLVAGGLGAQVDVAKVPRSEALRRHLEATPADIELLLRGGEDYELLFCCAAEQESALDALSAQLDLALTRIGSLREGSGLELLGGGQTNGRTAFGHDHFSG